MQTKNWCKCGMSLQYSTHSSLHMQPCLPKVMVNRPVGRTGNKAKSTHTTVVLHQVVLCLTPSSSVLAGLLSPFSSISLRSVCRLDITSLKLALTSLSVSWNPASSSETEGVARGSLLSARKARETNV